MLIPILVELRHKTTGICAGDLYPCLIYLTNGSDMAQELSLALIATSVCYKTL